MPRRNREVTRYTRAAMRPLTLVLVPLLLAACGRESTDSKPSATEAAGSSAAAAPGGFEVVIDQQPPLWWVQLDGGTLLYACEPRRGSVSVRRFSGSGEPVEVARLPEESAATFAIGDKAYWFAKGDRILRLPKTGGDSKEFARFPGEVELIAVDVDDLYVSLRPSLTAAENGDGAAVTIGGEPLTTVPTGEIYSSGGGLYRIAKDSKEALPTRIATLEAAKDLRVTSDAVYWLEALSHTLHRVAKDSSSALPSRPIDGIVLGYAVDDLGLVAIRGNSQKADLVGLPASGPEVTYAAGKAVLVIYAMDDKRIVYREGLGPLLQVDRVGGKTSSIPTPGTTFFGFELDGDHAYAAVAGPINGVPTTGIVRIPL